MHTYYEGVHHPICLLIFPFVDDIAHIFCVFKGILWAHLGKLEKLWVQYRTVYRIRICYEHCGIATWLYTLIQLLACASIRRCMDKFETNVSSECESFVDK